MLAGVRTSLSFIGFSFTIFNVLRYVKSIVRRKSCGLRRRGMSHSSCLVAGTVPLFVMMIQYYRSLKRMGKRERR
mgnify:CR=1 FL=1